MSSTVTTTTTTTEPTSSTAPIKVNVGRLQCTGNEAPFGDFRDDLVRDGYAVVKEAVPADRAADYAEEMYEWLEGFNLGFNRHDISTYTGKHLPVINEKGMVMEYSVPHENFVWQVRSEPGVIGAFEKVYDTKDLIVSFDAVNLTLPHRTDLPENKPWPHQDQDPEKHGFRCLQGLVNLLPNGPDDGGLIVCKGAHLLSTEFHKVFAEEEKIWTWTKEWYGFTDAGLAWLESKGCVWEKICAEPGDLLLWDSRTPHYNLSSKTDNPRFAMYTCYMPVSDVSQEDLKRKKDAFERRVGTTHWPNAEHIGSNVMMIESLEKRLQVRQGGVPDPYNRVRPVKEPILSERAFKLTGIPYVKE